MCDTFTQAQYSGQIQGRRSGLIQTSLYKMSGTYCDKVKKGIVHPKNDHEGQDEEYRYSSTFSLTSAQMGLGGQHPPSPGRFTPPPPRRMRQE